MYPMRCVAPKSEFRLITANSRRMAKKQQDKRGIVYSTNPDFKYQEDDADDIETLLPGQQKLRVAIDRKQRKGKEVTLVTGFVGKEEDLEVLGKLLKSKCGSGGSVKDGEIIVQGNHREKVVQLLKELSYSDTKATGG